MASRAIASLLGEIDDWTALDHFLLRYMTDPEHRATAIASSFAATLEMVREGSLEIRQDGAFQPLYLRKGAGAKGAAASSGDGRLD